MKGTLDPAFELNKFIKYSMVLKSWKKIKYSPKREGQLKTFWTLWTEHYAQIIELSKGHHYKAF